MKAKRTIVRGANKNCRSKDPATCRYHGEAFVPLTKPSEYVAQIFEQVTKDLSPSMVIPAEPDIYEDLWDRRFYEEEEMTLDQRVALHRYSDEYGSMRIRAVLMNPEKTFDFNGESMETIHSNIEALDSVLEEHSTDVSDMALWRGVKEFKYELSEITEGSVFNNLSYTPTSTDPEIAVSFSNKQYPILLRIRAKEGYLVGGQFVSEKEVLLKRGMQFRVTSIKENVHLERKNPRFGEDSRVRGITLVEIEEL